MEPMSSAEIFIRPEYNLLELSSCSTYLPHHTPHTSTYIPTLITHMSHCTTVWSQQYTTLDIPMQYVSYISNPVMLYTILFPAIYWFASRRLGITLVFIIAVTDIVNAMLKWPVQGDRPYWYSPYVREFVGTCESGYGMPSGHAQVNTAVFVSMLYHYNHNHITQQQQKSTYNTLMYAALFAIPLVCWSRVHMGAHFVGQTIIGVVLGYITAHIISRYNILQFVEKTIYQYMQRHSRSFATVITISVLSGVALIMLAVLELSVLSLVGIDALNSVTLKSQGCGDYKTADRYNTINDTVIQLLRSNQPVVAQPIGSTDFTHVNTPVMSVVRDAGLISGWLVYVCMHLVRMSKSASLPQHHDDDRLLHDDSVFSGTAAYTSLFSTDAMLLRPSIPAVILSYAMLFGVIYVLSMMVSGVISVMPGRYVELVQYVLNYAEFIMITLSMLVLIPSVTKRVLRQ